MAKVQWVYAQFGAINAGQLEAVDNPEDVESDGEEGEICEETGMPMFSNHEKVD